MWLPTNYRILDIAHTQTHTHQNQEDCLLHGNWTYNEVIQLWLRGCQLGNVGPKYLASYIKIWRGNWQKKLIWLSYYIFLFTTRHFNFVKWNKKSSNWHLLTLWLWRGPQLFCWIQIGLYTFIHKADITTKLPTTSCQLGE